MKHLKSILRGCSLLILVATFVACGSNNNDSDTNINSSGAEYYIKATGSDDVTIDIIVIVVDGASHSLQIDKKLPYTSPKYKAKDIIGFVISAEGTNQNSSLIVELIKDGKVIKTSTSKGQFISASIGN